MVKHCSGIRARFAVVGAALLVLCFDPLLCGSSLLAEMPVVFGKTFEARDTLDVKVELNYSGVRDSESAATNPKTASAAEELGWKPETFEVRCERPDEWRYDALLRFPSAEIKTPSKYDPVAVEWHMARDEEGEIVDAPALIIVHESGSGMAVGKTFAMLLSRAGLHTFMVQLPGYGLRRNPEQRSQASDSVTKMRQAVRDVRRTWDAVRVLPMVDRDHVGIQGTSLGGFVAATAAGLDGCFDYVFIMLAGGNVYEVIQHGERDAAKVREKLAAEGLTGTRLQKLLENVEPINFASRINPERSWLFSANRDQVVPMQNAYAWAKAVGLSADHHIIVDADHYSGIAHLPTMVLKIRDTVRQDVER